MTAWLKGWRQASVAVGLAMAIGIGCWWFAPRTPNEKARAATYSAKLGEAEKALAAGEPSEARAKLAGCDSTLRGWEWRALMALTGGVPAAKPLMPMMDPGDAVLSANGRVAAALFDPGDEYATLHAFDLAGGKRMIRLPPEGVVDGKFWGERVALSANGRLLGASSGHHYYPRRKPWHITIFGRDARGKVGDEWVRLEKIDGQWLEAERHIERAGFALVLDLQARSPLKDRELLGSRGPIALGGPKRVYAPSGDFWNLSGWDGSGQSHPGGEVTSLDLSPDEKLLAVGRGNGVVQLRDASTGVEKLRVSAAEKAGAVVRVRFSPDGQLLAVSDAGGVTVRDTAGGNLLARIAGTHAATAFTPDGRLLLAPGPRVPPRKKPLTLEGHKNHIRGVAFSRDGKRIVSGGDGGTVRVWDADTGQVLHSLQGRTVDAFISVAFSPDGKRILAGGPRRVQMWDADTGNEMRSLEGHTDWVRSVAFSPDGKRIASGSADYTVKVWDAATGKETLTFKGHTDSVTSVAFSPDGKLIASGCFGPSRTVKVWDVATGKELLTFRGHTADVSSLAYSPDGKRIVSTAGGIVKVWDAATGKETLSQQKHKGHVAGLAFSRDGKRVVSGGNDQTVQVWDSETGRRVFTLKGHTAEVTSVAISSDGERIVSGSGDGTVRVWDTKMIQVAPGNQDNRSVAVYEARTGVRLCGLPGLADRVADLVCRADGSLVVLGVVGADLAARELAVGDPDEERLTAASEDAVGNVPARTRPLPR